ncbi:MAG: hypothetical protein U0271_29865 [Polyangiaceae bacterium]
MARKDNGNLRTRITTLLARLDNKSSAKLPASLAPTIKAMRAAVEPYLAAADRADTTLSTRDAALEKVANADAVLDQTIEDLAIACVGAKLGKRTQPFAAFGAPAPSKLVKLAYRKEVEAVTKLLTALAKADSPAPVKAAAAKVQKNVLAVESALDALDGPEAAHVKARTARDAKLVEASRALARFRIQAKAALLDDVGAFEGLFAAESAVAAPTKTKRKSPAKKEPAPAG